MAFLWLEHELAGLHHSDRFPMLDLVYLALGIAGFAACLGYVFLCERL